MQAKILRRKDVENMVGLSRSTIYKLMNQGLFPKAIRLGPRAVGWRISDIENWINQQAARS
jgi:prophage regulatory protein